MPVANAQQQSVKENNSGHEEQYMASASYEYGRFGTLRCASALHAHA
jgi:hypothetical protein